jgi:hypothetical protein
VDTCLYTFFDAGLILILVVYVDDLIIASNSTDLVSKFKTSITGRFNTKDLGDLKYFLGINIERDRSKKLLTMDQSTYIKGIISKFRMDDCTPAATPSADQALTKGGSAASDAAFMASVPYQSAVGSLLYAAVITRPDISNAVREVSRYMHSPRRAHWAACLKVIRYLKGTVDYKLAFDFGGDTSLALTGFCDANHASDLDTRRSTTGYLFLFGGAPVSWASRMQPTVALSSTEAEYMAATEATNEAIHLRQLFSDMGFPESAATVIFEDNQSAIKLASNPIHHRRSKHIDVRYHHIRHHITAGTIRLEYVHTSAQLADSLTKAVPGAALQTLTTAVFVV